MSLLQSCSEILKQIYVDKKSFSTCLRNVVHKTDFNKQHFGEISRIVSSELRHHLFLEFVLNSQIKIALKDNQKYLVLCALSSLYFAKQINEKEVQDEIKKKLSPNDFKKLNPFLKEDQDLNQLILEARAGGESKEFLSIRYNTPLWFIKMIVSDFGTSMSQKILKRNIQPNKVCLSVNQKETTTKKITTSYKEDFIDFKEVEGTVLYKGKKGYFAHEAFQDGLVFPLKMGIKKLIRDLNFQKVKNVVAYVNNSSYVALEILLKYSGPKNNLTIVYPGGENFKYFENYVSKHVAKNVHLIKSDSPLDKLISTKQDLVIINPKSSSFDLIKEQVDFFNTFDQDCFDELVEEQMNRLIQAKNITNSKGKIVYFIDTIHKEEGNLLINEFKKLDDQIIDKEEKTRFSFEIFDTSMYYAILTKA